MTVNECVAKIRRDAASCGMTPVEYADAISNATREDIAQVMERLPTDALEFAVKFEALSHREESK